MGYGSRSQSMAVNTSSGDRMERAIPSRYLTRPAFVSVDLAAKFRPADAIKPIPQRRNPRSKFPHSWRAAPNRESESVDAMPSCVASRFNRGSLSPG